MGFVLLMIQRLLVQEPSGLSIFLALGSDQISAVGQEPEGLVQVLSGIYVGLDPEPFIQAPSGLPIFVAMGSDQNLLLVRNQRVCSKYTLQCYFRFSTIGMSPNICCWS